MRNHPKKTFQWGKDLSQEKFSKFFSGENFRWPNFFTSGRIFSFAKKNY